MKTTRTILCVGLICVLVLTMLLVGCGDRNQSGLTVDEPDITVEYLEGDYVDQLIRDGAEHVFGTIEVTQVDEETISVDIAAKVFVEDSSQLNGFYIEDKNYSLSKTLNPEARITFLTGEVSLPQIMSPTEFVKAYDEDLAKNGDTEEYRDSKLYDIYIMGDQIELVLAKYLP